MLPLGKMEKKITGQFRLCERSDMQKEARLFIALLKLLKLFLWWMLLIFSPTLDLHFIYPWREWIMYAVIILNGNLFKLQWSLRFTRKPGWVWRMKWELLKSCCKIRSVVYILNIKAWFAYLTGYFKFPTTKYFLYLILLYWNDSFINMK